MILSYSLNGWFDFFNLMNDIFVTQAIVPILNLNNNKISAFATDKKSSFEFLDTKITFNDYEKNILFSPNGNQKDKFINLQNAVSNKIISNSQNIQTDIITALSDFDKVVKKQLTFAEKTLLQGVLHLNVMVLKR